ncbi:hypothetical protein TNCT_688701 [Trichonephila clavata]|uniref:Uncharacterized protein n=1 Tax=Trichonephila clavata TaxID=2740835 RepID=A0A8X6FBT2_TRICU|nr:hypothetical protein TNCT_688701 [Trichonephila clavata]
MPLNTVFHCASVCDHDPQITRHFDQIVYQYHKSQQNHLVYVALSHGTSLDGLYMINTRNDLKFSPDLVRHLLQLERYEMSTRDSPNIRCRH